MPEYLTKEEEKEWRRSLEKITLEEFAARRGKVIPENKPTNDMVDHVMGKSSVIIRTDISGTTEKLPTIKPVIKEVKPEPKIEKPVQKIEVKTPEVKQEKLPVEKPKKVETVQKQVSESADFAGVEFEKPLTDREQKVFEMFYKNAGHIVYAKDLADLLALPRDYVYKYIKTLRAKIKGDKLENADKGGYVLKI